MKETDVNTNGINNRLIYFINSRGDNFSKLSSAIGCSNSYFNKMIKNNGSIGVNMIYKIFDYYKNLNPDWLITGNGPMLKKEVKEEAPIFPDDKSASYLLNSPMESLVPENLEYNKESFRRMISIFYSREVEKDAQIKRLLSLLERQSKQIENLIKVLPDNLKGADR